MALRIRGKLSQYLVDPYISHGRCVDCEERLHAINVLICGNSPCKRNRWLLWGREENLVALFSHLKNMSTLPQSRWCCFAGSLCHIWGFQKHGRRDIEELLEQDPYCSISITGNRTTAPMIHEGRLSTAFIWHCFVHTVQNSAIWWGLKELSCSI